MTSKNQFENQLRESLQYGFINHKQYQDKLYSPKVVLNKRETGEKCADRNSRAVRNMSHIHL